MDSPSELSCSASVSGPNALDSSDPLPDEYLTTVPTLDHPCVEQLNAIPDGNRITSVAEFTYQPLCAGASPWDGGDNYVANSTVENEALCSASNVPCPNTCDGESVNRNEFNDDAVLSSVLTNHVSNIGLANQIITSSGDSTGSGLLEDEADDNVIDSVLDTTLTTVNDALTAVTDTYTIDNSCAIQLGQFNSTESYTDVGCDHLSDSLLAAVAEGATSGVCECSSDNDADDDDDAADKGNEKSQTTSCSIHGGIGAAGGSHDASSGRTGVSKDSNIILSNTEHLCRLLNVTLDSITSSFSGEPSDLQSRSSFVPPTRTSVPAREPFDEENLRPFQDTNNIEQNVQVTTCLDPLSDLDDEDCITPSELISCNPNSRFAFNNAFINNTINAIRQSGDNSSRHSQTNEDLRDSSNDGYCNNSNLNNIPDGDNILSLEVSSCNYINPSIQSTTTTLANSNSVISSSNDTTAEGCNATALDSNRWPVLCSCEYPCNRRDCINRGRSSSRGLVRTGATRRSCSGGRRATTAANSSPYRCGRRPPRPTVVTIQGLAADGERGEATELIETDSNSNNSTPRAAEVLRGSELLDGDGLDCDRLPEFQGGAHCHPSVLANGRSEESLQRLLSSGFPNYETTQVDGLTINSNSGDTLTPRDNNEGESCGHSNNLSSHNNSNNNINQNSNHLGTTCGGSDGRSLNPRDSSPSNPDNQSSYTRCSVDRLRFHEKCGLLVRLSNNGRTAERKRPLDEFNNGVVMSNRALRENELFEVNMRIESPTTC